MPPFLNATSSQTMIRELAIQASPLHTSGVLVTHRSSWLTSMETSLLGSVLGGDSCILIRDPAIGQFRAAHRCHRGAAFFTKLMVSEISITQSVLQRVLAPALGYHTAVPAAFAEKGRAGEFTSWEEIIHALPVWRGAATGLAGRSPGGSVCGGC